MSQVLEKPILLDETGQAIAGKLDTNSAAIVDALDDIKDAIGTSSEFIPVMIKVVTPPTKTIYKVGERLDLSGMVVNLIGTNGVNIDVTQACTFVPANGATLTNANTSVAISYHYAAGNLDFSTSQALTIRELDSIAVTTPPIKTAYQTGETLDLTGIVVTATYSDGYTANVTADCIFNPTNGTVLQSGDDTVTVTYTEGSVTKTTSAAIGVKERVSIAVTRLPNKTAYHAGEVLDLTGIVVTATYDNASTLDVTNNCSFSPLSGATLSPSNTSVTISYSEGSISKTTPQVITVSTLDAIAVTTPPTKTSYNVGESLDLAGIVVTATYTDNSTENVTADCIFNPTNGTTLTMNDDYVSITYTEYGITKTTTQELELPKIYGVEWDGTATTSFTRTDNAANFTDPVPQYSDGNGGWTTGSSPFDTIQPWAGMVRITDTDAGELVAIPKFYFKMGYADTTNSTGLKIQISTSPLEGYSVSPAHQDRGDGVGERDVVYIGRYHSANTYKSLSGVVAKYSLTRAAFRSGIHSLGSDIWQNDYALRVTLWLLYLVEFADWNSQAKIGGGIMPSGPSVNTGYTDDMTYHTGTTATSIARTVYGGTQYRNIEGLWDNITDWCDGFNIWSNGIYVTLNPSNFNDDETGYTRVGTRPTTSGYISKFTISTAVGFEWFIFPSNVNGGEDTYICDQYVYNKPGKNLCVGGQFGLQQQGGMFYVNTSNSHEIDSIGIGSRLMKLPTNS